MVTDPLPSGGAVRDAPSVEGFRRRRTTFDIDLAQVFEKVRNGIRIPTLTTEASIQERDFLHWLRQVGGVGSRPEHQVYRALERTGRRSPTSRPDWGLDFQFQVPLLGGRSQAGGAVVDFVVYDIFIPGLVLRVQGEFFHFSAVDVEEADIMGKLALESEGFKVVDILAQEALTPRDADQVVALALGGFETDFEGKLGIIN